MRNLKLLKSLCLQFGEFCNSQFFVIGTVDLNLNSYNNLPSVFFYKDFIIYRWDAESKLCSLVVNLKHHFSDLLFFQIAAIEFNQLSQSLIVVTSRGDVLNIPVVNNESSEIECVGAVDCGIKAMSWSPDEGIVILVTNEDKLILMSATFDLITEINLLTSTPVRNEFVSVGWGKKETQFHGSEGKQTAKKIQTVLAENLFVDDKKVRISWRGDSSLFAVSYFCPLNNTRTIKIFNNEGVLEAVNELVGGLEESLAWRPSGNLIASTQILPNKHIVCFFEKNGLRHGDFSLPDNIKVKDLLWNNDSNILGAHCSDTTTDEDSVLLWTVNNYHWYLKQKLQFHSKIVSLKWDVLSSNRLFLFTAAGTIFVYDWIFSVDQSENFSSKSESFVGVINGSELFLTPFKKCIIPPPLCKYSLNVPTFINEVFFLQDDSGGGSINDLGIISDRKLYLFNYVTVSSQHELKGRYEFPDISAELLHHWLWISHKLFYCVGSTKNFENIVCLIELEDEKLTVRQSTTLEHPVLTLTKKEKQLLIQVENGNLFLFKTDSCTFEEYSEAALPEPCFQVKFDVNLFALSFTHRLYINNRQIATGLTSVYYHRPFLLATTTQPRLLIFDSDVSNDCDELSIRNIERGAKLVTCTGHSVILQIPRGNLETIQPRALTLLTAGNLINVKDYLGAISLLRKHRIDLNLIVDHNPVMFLRNVSDFVRQIEDVSWISLFISDLHNNDVTKGIYAAYFKKNFRPLSSLSNKVETICKTLCDEMLSIDPNKYCLPILGTYVKTNQMEKALELAQSDTTLKYLLFLVDIDKLYEAALATYDLEMALKIAGKSQKDPKEYVPFLNLLKSMEPNYRMYTIDKRLFKHKSALCHLAKCEDKYEEFENYMMEFSLYSPALSLFDPEDSNYRKIAKRYGDHLFKKRFYEEAAFMFERSHSLDDAVTAYCKAGLWKECILLANKLGYESNKMESLYMAIIKQLKSVRNYSDAGLISANFLKDISLSVEIYLQGLLFSDAIFVAESNQMSDLVSKLIEPGIKDIAISMLEDVSKDKEKFNKHVSRLKQVRIDKQNNIVNDPNFLSDLHSDTSSVSSFNTSNASSHSSRTTCKSARKQQRKLWSLKEGNPREEISLISTLSSLIELNHKLTKDVHEICKVLLKFGDMDKAKKLQQSLSELLKIMTDNQSIIWPEPMNDESRPISIEEAQLRYPPALPVNKSWELSILNQP